MFAGIQQGPKELEKRVKISSMITRKHATTYKMCSTKRSSLYLKLYCDKPALLMKPLFMDRLLDLLAHEVLCAQQREVCAVSQGYPIYARSQSDVKGTCQHHRSGCCHCIWLLVKECHFQTCDSCFAFLAVEQCSGLTLASDFDTSDRAQNKRLIILLYCEGMTFLTPQPWCWQEGQMQ